MEKNFDKSDSSQATNSIEINKKTLDYLNNPSASIAEHLIASQPELVKKILKNSQNNQAKQKNVLRRIFSKLTGK